MKQQAVLDFSDDGKAVVQIPDVGEIAFINMFGFSPINEVERDIEVAEPERKRFLEKYLQIYKEMYGDENTWSTETKEMIDKFQKTLISKMPTFEISCLDYLDYEDEQYREAWDALSDIDSPEFDKAFEESYIKRISVNVYKTKHSTAWYLFGHVEADVKAAEKLIECKKGLPIVIDNLHEVCDIIRHAVDVKQAKSRLEKEIGLTKNQAAYTVGYRLSELAGMVQDNVKESIADSEKLLAFLRKL